MVRKEVLAPHVGVDVPVCVSDVPTPYARDDLLAEPSEVPTPEPTASSGETLKNISAAELEFKQCIGSGATAEVFRGVFKGQFVAIKQMNIGLMYCADVKGQVAFSREVSVMEKARHENLVGVLGISHLDSKFLIITEFCEGGTCHELLHNCCHIDLMWGQKLTMCRDVAAAMEYLHTMPHQIIHRDLKSTNLLLVSPVRSSVDTPWVKISDFGLARIKDESSEWQRMTRAVGSLHWTAPEVHTGEYTEKADIYSYAMVLFEIVCREIPFDDEEPGQVPMLTLAGNRPDMDAIPCHCPEALVQLMQRCWNGLPENRPSFTQIRGVLSNIAI
mmetsp:Transcript_25365/g.70562  ORF Transcript_25365/g.70562 Transcript_25365/m.70562 type:complete len:331 (+) Transcript_25365:36-1028(+)